jgi:hypothetical protein
MQMEKLSLLQEIVKVIWGNEPAITGSSIIMPPSAVSVLKRNLSNEKGKIEMFGKLNY